MIRHWKQGDIFYPFGMQQKKKLSDFFIDNKFSILEKENTWLLCSGDDIIWIMGHRADNRFRITDHTKELVIFEMLD
jgi:tRNA(Ile)-lysidine synthase